MSAGAPVDQSGIILGKVERSSGRAMGFTTTSTESVTGGRRDLTSNAAVRTLICVAAVIVVIVVLYVLPVPHDRLLAAGLNFFLVIVLVVSIRWGTRYAVLVSTLSALAYSFAMPPAGHFHYDGRVLTLFTACLVTGVVAGQLSTRVRSAALEARAAEAAARRSEQELRGVIETIPAIAWSARPDGANDFANRRWTEYTGLPVEQTAGSGFEAAIHPEDLQRHRDEWRAALATGEPFEVEARLRRADGQYRWNFVRGVPLRDEHGKILKWYGISTDVEDRRQAREALRRSEAYLAETQRLTHTASFVWDIETKQELYLSDEWYRIYGFDPEKDLAGPSAEGEADVLRRAAFNRHAWEERFRRILPEDRVRWQAAVDRAIKEQSDYELEYGIALPDGTFKYLHVLGHPILDATGRVVQFMGSVTDITDRRRAEEERERLRQRETELARINRISTMGELTASLAHEINQPIAAAVTNANTSVRWLANEVPNLQEAREAAKRAANDATRAAEIVNRIRSLFRKGAPERELVDINQIIDEMTALLWRTEADRHGISVRRELAVDLPAVMADHVQLQQVVLNLMMNGIDAMKAVASARVLTLASQRNGSNQLLISVSDTGVGLPSEQSKIFEAFFTTKPHGTGMGLAISRTIIESHGGRLWATSNPGGGSTFYFTLPTVVQA